MQADRACYFCGRQTGLERHHVFAGVANRNLADRAGLWVYLCKSCHTGKNGAQYDKEKNLLLKQDAQRCFEKHHPRSEWMKLIGKNYIG